MKNIFIALLITLSLLGVSCKSTNEVEASVPNNFEIVSEEEIDTRIMAYIVKDKIYGNEYIKK